MVNINGAGIVVIVSTLAATAFIIPIVKALPNTTLPLLLNSSQNFLNMMNYPSMLDKALTQCKNIEKKALSDTLACVQLVSDVYNLLVLNERQAAEERMQKAEEKIAYEGCVTYESNNFLESPARFKGISPEEYCSSLDYYYNGTRINYYNGTIVQ